MVIYEPMARRQKKEVNKERISNEFEAFKKKLNASKHAFWFEVLDPHRQFKLFILWKQKKHDYTLRDKSISFNKFIFIQRETKKFHVPKVLIRDNAINKILTK